MFKPTTCKVRSLTSHLEREVLKIAHFHTRYVGPNGSHIKLIGVRWFGGGGGGSVAHYVDVKMWKLRQAGNKSAYMYAMEVIHWAINQRGCHWGCPFKLMCGLTFLDQCGDYSSNMILRIMATCRSNYGGGGRTGATGGIRSTCPPAKVCGPPPPTQHTEFWKNRSTFEKVVHPLVPPWKLDPSYATGNNLSYSVTVSTASVFTSSSMEISELASAQNSGLDNFPINIQ